MRIHRIKAWKVYSALASIFVVTVLVRGFQVGQIEPNHVRSSPRLVPQASLPEDRGAKISPTPNALPDQEDLTKLFPPSELPVVATAEGARTSLRYLAENGADLTRPMPSRHRVFAANARIAAQMAGWGRANGFEVRGPVLIRSHTGEPQQSLEFVRTEVPDPARIEHEGRLVLAAVQRTPGTYYQTWSGEIVR